MLNIAVTAVVVSGFVANEIRVRRRHLQAIAAMRQSSEHRPNTPVG